MKVLKYTDSHYRLSVLYCFLIGIYLFLYLIGFIFYCWKLSILLFLKAKRANVSALFVMGPCCYRSARSLCFAYNLSHLFSVFNFSLFYFSVFLAFRFSFLLSSFRLASLLDIFLKSDPFR